MFWFVVIASTALAGYVAYLLVDERYFAQDRLQAKRMAYIAERTALHRRLPKAERRAQIQRDPYFDIRFGNSKAMRETAAAQCLFAAVNAGVFEFGPDPIGEHIGALVLAERELGHDGRPMVLDYDLELVAMLCALSNPSAARH